MWIRNIFGKTQCKPEMQLLLIALLWLGAVNGWQNGLARTPPMGWMDWLKYECNIDCLNHPKACINEQLYKDMVDRIVEDGYLELGYDTVNIDDCWMEKNRDPDTSRLVPDRHRFPNGIKSLADYAHSRGVKLGIYEDVGRFTCQKYPGTLSPDGSIDYTAIDAKTFSDWGIDSLKLDGCYVPDSIPYNRSYPQYSKELSNQGKCFKLIHFSEFNFKYLNN